MTEALPLHKDYEPPMELNLQQTFYKELTRSADELVVAKPISDEKYKKEIQAVKPYLNMMTEPELSRFFQNFYTQGSICTVVALPFNSNCTSIEEAEKQGQLGEFISGRNFFYVFITDPKTGKTAGFKNGKEGQFFDLLPDRLKRSLDGEDLRNPHGDQDIDVPKPGCSFMIKYPGQNSETNKEWLLKNISMAIVNLEDFANEAPAN